MGANFGVCFVRCVIYIVVTIFQFPHLVCSHIQVESKHKCKLNLVFLSSTPFCKYLFYQWQQVIWTQYLFKAIIRVYFERLCHPYTTSCCIYCIVWQCTKDSWFATTPALYSSKLWKKTKKTVMLCQSKMLIHIYQFRKKGSATKWYNHRAMV